MARATPTPLQRQITKVSRRLFWQTVLDTLVWCWTWALVVAVGWFLAQPFVLEEPKPWLRWAVTGGLLGVGSVLALILAFVRAPSRLAAALSLDERFGLKERVTTSLTLAPEQAGSSAAQALLADVNQRLGQLDVGERFPIGVSRSAVLVPAMAMLLACVAFLYDPMRGQATASANDDKKPAPNAAAVDQKMKELVRKKDEKKPATKNKSEELEQLEAKLEEIANRPRSTKEQLRDRIKEMTALEDQMKKHEKELAEKNQSLKQAMRQLDKLSDKEAEREGPGKDLEKAIKEGDFDKAKDELEHLAKKMAENELTEKEKMQLAKQIQKLEEKLKNIAEGKEKEEELKKLAREGKLDAETLKRELAELKKDTQKLKELADLAQKLGQCKECLNKGDTQAAAKGLQEAGQKLQKMGLDEQDMKDLQEQLKKLGECKECAANGGMQRADKPGGKRPVDPESPFKSYDSRNKVDFDPKGKKIFDGYAPGENFKKRSTAEIAGEIQQASQEAPEAIEQQRIPKAARDMAKDYFRNLGGQAEKNQKK